MDNDNDNSYSGDEPYESGQDEGVNSVPGDTESNRTDSNDEDGCSSDEAFCEALINEGRRKCGTQRRNGHRIPQNTSTLTGAMHVAEILNNPNEADCRHLFRMSQTTFRNLARCLREYGELDDQNLMVEESLAIFLFITSHCAKMRTAQHFFQHSLDTIHRHMKSVSRALCTLGKLIVRPTHMEGVHPYVRCNRNYYPWFKDCIGAIDGTYISCWVPKELHTVYRCRKGFLAQNVICAVDFSGRFTFVYPGWEGTTHDARVLMDAMSRPENKFPMPNPGYFYVVDSGLPCLDGFLPPHRSVRYHLSRFQESGAARGPKELFNYRHSSLRNIVERMFGKWKAKFVIFEKMPRYSLPMQRNIIMACATVHNFLIDAGDEEAPVFDYEDLVTENFDSGSSSGTGSSSASHTFDEHSSAVMSARRAQITEAMWADATN